MAAPILGGIVKYALTFNTAKAQTGIKALQGSLKSLAASAQQSASTVMSSALGPFASPTGMASQAVSPIGEFLDRNQGSITSAFFNNPWARFTGGARLFNGIRGARSDLVGVNRAFDRYSSFVENWARQTGSAPSNTVLDQVGGLLRANEMNVEREMDRARDAFFKDSTVGAMQRKLFDTLLERGIRGGLEGTGRLGWPFGWR